MSVWEMSGVELIALSNAAVDAGRATYERRHLDAWIGDGRMRGMACRCGYLTRSHYAMLDAQIEMGSHINERHRAEGATS